MSDLPEVKPGQMWEHRRPYNGELIRSIRVEGFCHGGYLAAVNTWLPGQSEKDAQPTLFALSRWRDYNLVESAPDVPPREEQR